MKSINNYIQEALIKKDTKINNNLYKQEIIDIVLSITGYLYVADQDPNSILCDQISKLVSQWIEDYKIKEIKSIWMITERDVLFVKICDRVKKNSSNININLIKQVDDLDKENDLMIHIVDGAKSYEIKDSDDIVIGGNSMGLCFEYDWGRIGFMTQDKFDSI